MVLKAPKWDGTPFIVTTDGCKEGFAAIVAQHFETVSANGTKISKLYPIGFRSKCTSLAERNYKPFLLEFTALKFRLDKFSDTIWGFPIEIKMDCQALMSNKLNATHVRWRDGILAHQIVDMWHIPRHLNVVADGLSRIWEGREREDGDGSEWEVSEDWEAARGLVNDMFGIEDLLRNPTETNWAQLREQFIAEPVFQEYWH